MSGNEKQKFINIKTSLPTTTTTHTTNNNSINNNNNNNNSNFNNNINSNVNLAKNCNESKDVVDFVVRTRNVSDSGKFEYFENSNFSNGLLHQGKPNGINGDVKMLTTSTITPTKNNIINNNNSDMLPNKKQQQRISANLYNDCEVKSSIKTSLSTLEKLPIFKIHAKKKLFESTTTTPIQTTNAPQIIPEIKSSSPILGILKDRPKFSKSASIARLLGNTYNTKKIENELYLMNSGNTGNISGTNNSNGNGLNSINSNSNNNNTSGNGVGSSNTNSITNSRPFPGAERFQKCTQLENEVINVNNNGSASGRTGNSCQQVHLSDFSNDKDLGSKTFRTISRSLAKLLRRRTHSIDISTPDPEYKVSYLGNVLTGWAKGEGCVEKPLNTLWRNYTQNHKPDVVMRVRVSASGLKATTRQHGLTEYWAHRITHCCAPKNYPRVFCWIYRHEGRKLKHEMRCHAVLCTKESIAQDICNMLRENLDRALREFKREKLSKQNARLSLANAAYENPSLPRRKILLSVGGNNYRPPLERSKSAPKLMAIEEAIGEEEGEDIEQTNEPEMPSCCQKDSLYPAMTLGRRKCRRGHSIRRTGKVDIHTIHGCKGFSMIKNETEVTDVTTKESSNQEVTAKTTVWEKLNSNTTSNSQELSKDVEEISSRAKTKSVSSLASDEDDLDKVLISHNYDVSSPLAGELLSYFDMKLKPVAAQSLNDLDDTSILFEPKLNSDSQRRPALSLDNLDSFSDCADEDDGVDDYDDPDEVFYQQSAILNLLHRNSLTKMANLSIECDNGNLQDLKIIRKIQPTPTSVLNIDQPQQLFDSDEGSISSGCETASTVTANMDDSSLKYIQQQQQNGTNCYNTPEQQKHLQEEEKNNFENNVLTSTNICLNNKSTSDEYNKDTVKISNTSINFKLPQLLHTDNDVNRPNDGGDVSDSECSDESGYVEYQEHHQKCRESKIMLSS